MLFRKVSCLEVYFLFIYFAAAAVKRRSLCGASLHQVVASGRVWRKARVQHPLTLLKMFFKPFFFITTYLSVAFKGHSRQFNLLLKK